MPHYFHAPFLSGHLSLRLGQVEFAGGLWLHSPSAGASNVDGTPVLGDRLVHSSGHGGVFCLLLLLLALTKLCCLELRASTKDERKRETSHRPFAVVIQTRDTRGRRRKAENVPFSRGIHAGARQQTRKRRRNQTTIIDACYATSENRNSQLATLSSSLFLVVSVIPSHSFSNLHAITLHSSLEIEPNTMTLSDLFSLSRDDALKYMFDGLPLILGTLGVTMVFELFSLQAVRSVLKQPNGSELYMKAISLNFFNPLCLGFPLYVVARALCSNSEEPFRYIATTLEVFWLIGAHAVLYYAIHKAFHESPRFYNMFHRFHHRFNTHVPPSAANAVTPGEYVIAYLIPFALAVLFRPTQPESLKISISVISFTNILVHTPKLESLSEKWVPEFLVSTKNHLDHHRKLKVHYASPTFNVDNIIRQFTITPKNANSTEAVES